MVSLFSNKRDFKINYKSISTSVELYPKYNLTALHRIAINADLLTPLEWCKSDECSALLERVPNYARGCDLFKSYDQINIFVDNRLVFLGYLKHVLMNDVQTALIMHTVNYHLYNKPDSAADDIFHLSEFNLTSIYDLLTDNPVFTPDGWIHSAECVELLKVMDTLPKGYNVGFSSIGIEARILFVQSSLMYLGYIKHCCGNDISTFIDRVIQSINNGNM